MRTTLTRGCQDFTCARTCRDQDHRRRLVRSVAVSTGRRRPARRSPPSAISSLAISPPKGEGAIPAIGERFAAPVARTRSMSVPIATSPGRSGFAPQTSLACDSAAQTGTVAPNRASRSHPSPTRPTSDNRGNATTSRETRFSRSPPKTLCPSTGTNSTERGSLEDPGGTRDHTGVWRDDIDGRLVIHEDDVNGYRGPRFRPGFDGLSACIQRWSQFGSPRLPQQATPSRHGGHVVNRTTRKRTDEAALELIHNTRAEAFLVAATCHGPQVLIAAGCFPRGTSATYVADTGMDVRNAGRSVLNLPAVHDQHRRLISDTDPWTLRLPCDGVLTRLAQRASRINSRPTPTQPQVAARSRWSSRCPINMRRCDALTLPSTSGPSRYVRQARPR